MRVSPPLSLNRISPRADSPSQFISPPNTHAWSGIVDPIDCPWGADDAADDSIVRYGDKIRLFSRSRYIRDESNVEGGYVGYYFRSRKGAKGEEGLILNGKETQLAVLSPAGPEKEILYHESHFYIVDPNGVKQDGDILRYGEEFVLVDDNGMSWNHSAGGIIGTNYLGFKKVGLPGELCLTFKQYGAEGWGAGGGREGGWSPGGVEGSPGVVAPSPRYRGPSRARSPQHPGSSPNSHYSKSKGGRKVFNTGNPPVRFNSDKMELIVTRSLRMNKKIGNPISNFKRGTSRVLGGYLSCEKIGFPLDFKIHRAPPSILTATTFSYHDSMQIHSFHNINWGEEIELTVPLDISLVSTQPLLSVTLSNGQYVIFSQKQILEKPGKAVWVDVLGATGEPSRLLCQFDCFSGNDNLSSLSIVKSNKRIFVIAWSAAIALVSAAVSGFFVKRSKFVYVNPAYGGSAKDEGMWDYYTSSLMGSEEPAATVCGSDDACASEKYLWSTTSILVSCVIGSLTSLLVAMGVIFYVFGNRVFMMEFIGRLGGGTGDRKKHLAPFVAVLLGWERGLAKDAGKTPKKKSQFSYPDKYGAIDPTTGLPPLPERFLIAEEHNHDKALERWRDTLRWRNEKKVDDVLNVPHSQYDAIKQYYPQFFHCRDRMGNMVYIERPGGVNLSRIKKHGITVKKLIWHYMYCIEYLWQRFSPLETDRLTTILDLKGVSILMVVGDVRHFIKGCIGMTSTHYPARGHKLFIVNSPRWLNQIWGWIKPMLNAQMEEKLKILTTGEKQTEELLKVIDEGNLPVEYGGKNEVPIGESKYDKEIREWVVGVLEKEGMEMDTWV